MAHSLKPLPLAVFAAAFAASTNGVIANESSDHAQSIPFEMRHPGLTYPAPTLDNPVPTVPVPRLPPSLQVPTVEGNFTMPTFGGAGGGTKPDKYEMLPYMIGDIEMERDY